MQEQPSIVIGAGSLPVEAPATTPPVVVQCPTADESAMWRRRYEHLAGLLAETTKVGDDYRCVDPHPSECRDSTPSEREEMGATTASMLFKGASSTNTWHERSRRS